MSKKNASSANSHTPPNLLITGSAGFVGRHLTRQLTEQACSSVNLYRAHLPEPLAHAVPIFGDLLRKEHINSALKGVDAVVHLAWNQSFRVRLEDVLRVTNEVNPHSRNLEIVSNLIRTMEENKTRRIVFLSALGVSRFAENHFLQEKYQAEAMILNSKIPEKIILRSSLIFGELSYRDRLVTAIENLMRFPWFYPIPRLKGKLAPIHVRDLAEIIWRLIDLPLTDSAHILEVTGQQELTLEEVFRLVSKGIGKRNQIALKGFLGEALTPLYERLHNSRFPKGPYIRELLTINNRRDPATSVNNALLTDLPAIANHSFQETMLMQRRSH